MTLAQEFERRGIEKGIQLGRKENVTLAQEFEKRGVQKGEVALLLRLLKHRFGEAAVHKYKQRISQADAQTLLRWGERVLEAVTVEDMFRDA